MVKAKVICAGGSNPGRVRRNNEDAWHVDPDRGIFLVVDGIGGQNAGEKAAEIAVNRVRNRLERLTGTTEQRISEAIAMANNEIFNAAQGNPDWHGMACVLTLAVLDNGSAVIGHVGDSRLYQIRRGDIRKITHDHSPVGEREDSRELTEEEAMRHPRRNEVFRDVGSEQHSPEDPDFIEIQRIPFDSDSALLLCSDGLSDLVTSAEIRRIVERHAGNPDAAVRDLIDAANRAGGKDNVTVVVVEGDQFAPAPVPVAAPADPPGLLSHRALWLAAFFLLGILAGASAVWFSRSFWMPPPRVITPRLWVVGPREELTSIAAALGKAQSGDTIEVLGGEYREQLALKDGITLRSGIPREAILRAAPLAAGPAVSATGIRGARLSGFLIQGDPQAPLPTGVLLINADVQLEDLEITGAGNGIEIRGGNPTLIGNAIHDCLANGILVTGASSPWIVHNSIQRNKVAGVAARAGARPSLVGNVLDKNTVELPPEISVDLLREKNFLLDQPRRPPSGGRK